MFEKRVELGRFSGETSKPIVLYSNKRYIDKLPTLYTCESAPRSTVKVVKRHSCRNVTRTMHLGSTKSPCPPPPPPVQQNTFVICVWAGRPPLFSRRAAPVVARRFKCAPGYVSSDVQVDRRRRANTCSRCRGSERHPSLSPSVRRGPCSPVPEARTCHQTRCGGRRVMHMVGRIPTVPIHI